MYYCCRAEMQVATTLYYATDSWFRTLATGALNRSPHYPSSLPPRVNQGHYSKIMPIIQKTCEEFGVKYHYVDSVAEAFGHHISHLKSLGQNKHACK